MREAFIKKANNGSIHAVTAFHWLCKLLVLIASLASSDKGVKGMGCFALGQSRVSCKFQNFVVTLTDEKIKGHVREGSEGMSLSDCFLSLIISNLLHPYFCTFMKTVFLLLERSESVIREFDPLPTSNR